MNALFYLLRSLAARTADVGDLAVRAVTQPDVICDFRASVRGTRFAGPNAVYGRSRIIKCSVGRFTYFAPDCTIMNSSFGSFCSIGPGVRMGMGRHPIRGWISASPCFFSLQKQAVRTFATKTQFEETRPTTVGNDVWVGANVCVMDGISIGDGAIIGTGAIVTKDVPPFAICLGVPGKVARMRFSDETIRRLLQLKWWNWDEARLKLAAEVFNFGEAQSEPPEQVLMELEKISAVLKQ